MNELKILMDKCKIYVNDNKAVLKVPKEMPVLGTMLSHYVGEGVISTCKNNKSSKYLFNLTSFWVCFNGFLE